MAACLDLDRPIYFSNHSLHAELSANGTVVTHPLKYNGPHESDPKEDERVLVETMNLLHPGWEKEVVARDHEKMQIDCSDSLTIGACRYRTKRGTGPIDQPLFCIKSKARAIANTMPTE